MATQTYPKWNRIFLKDAVTFKTGKLNSNASIINGKYPFFTCSQDIYRTNTYSFDTECVLLGGNNANAIYPIFYFNGKFDAYQRTYVIESKDNHIRYLYYLLRNKLNELRLQSTGSATKFLTLKILDQIPVNLPDLPTQKKISDFLSAYDDLIENNNRRIKILEEIAQKIYTEWFVNFHFPGYEKVKFNKDGLPEGWDTREIGTDIKILKGKNITRKTISNGIVPVVAGGIEPAYFHDKPNAPGPVITISASGANSGFVNLYYEDIWASDCSYINKKTTDFVFFYYSLLKTKQKEVTHLQRGSAQPHVYPKDIESIKSALPKDFSIIQNFEDVISPIYLSIGKLKQVVKILKSSRDLLIPQLVTGKREIK